jgi:tRNA(Arg) A34 adenosine deaminase TadA
LALSETELSRMKELMERCILTRSVLIVDPNNHDPKNPATNDSSNNENMNDGNIIDLGIVSISRIEQSLQGQPSQQQHDGSSASLLDNNPLATPILLALQGVSRRERDAKITVDRVTAVDTPSTGADSNKRHQEQQQQNQSQQKRGQYICTGYDMYSFYEPNIFEAMACLHSRLRRLVYFVPDSQSTLCSLYNKSPKGESRVSHIGNDAVAWGRGLSKHDIHHLSGTNHNYRAFEYRQSSYAS